MSPPARRPFSTDDASTDNDMADAAILPHHEIAQRAGRERLGNRAEAFRDQRMPRRQAGRRAIVAMHLGEAKQRGLFLRHVAVPAIGAERDPI